MFKKEEEEPFWRTIPLHFFFLLGFKDVNTVIGDYLAYLPLPPPSLPLKPVKSNELIQ